MSASKENEERLERAAGNRRRDRVSGEGAPPVRPTAKRTSKTRLTVDMDPPLRRRLKSWTQFAEDQLDVPEVSAAEVVRILVDLLTDVQSDPELRQAVVAQVLDRLQED